MRMTTGMMIAVSTSAAPRSPEHLLRLTEVRIASWPDVGPSPSPGSCVGGRAARHKETNGKIRGGGAGSGVAEAHPHLHRRRTEIERLADLALQVADVRGR